MIRLVDTKTDGPGAGHNAGPNADLDADLLIVGGGMIGLTLARACASAGVTSTVIDAVAPTVLTAPAFDGRCSAIAHASRMLLETIGVWPRLAADSQPILEIRVSDGGSPKFLHFDHRDIGDQPFGFMAENRHLRQALLAAAQDDELITVIAPAKLARIERHPGGITGILADGRRLSARLIVGADGRNSAVRKAAGIRTVDWRYRQAGLVATVEHERPHHGIAQEHFLAPGPFAILPLTGNRSSLVWTEREHPAPAFMALDQADFDAEISRRFGDYLGPLRSTGPRWCYPLALHNALRYGAPRLMLAGDAAHGIHPIAGQGLNLGFRDVAVIAEVVAEAVRLGLDPGAPDVIARYERWRRVDVLVMAAVTDGLNRLFSNDSAVLRMVRDNGLAVVNRIGPLKRFFMRHARGTVGKLPRLLTGRPL